MTATRDDAAATDVFPYQDKLLSVLSGCAYGDAWGNSNEFQSYERLTRHSKRGPDLPTRLIITDDTQMTLALARAIHTAGTRDANALRTAIINEFVAWRRDPDNTRAPGNTCMLATAALAAGQPWTAATVADSDGCGTVMRTSPAAFLPRHLWRPVAAWQAATTHGKASGIAATLVTTAIIREAARGALRPGNALGFAIELSTHPALLAGVGDWLAGHPKAATAAEAEAFLAAGMREVETVLRHAHRALDAFRADPWAKDPCRYAGEGWRAQETLAVALLCVDALPNSPIDALRRATVTNGDSDSIAAVAGAILGALHTNPQSTDWADRLDPGYRAWINSLWPAHWADRLEPRYRAWIAESANYRLA
jgi:ADP-ribosylglycohydrolase